MTNTFFLEQQQQPFTTLGNSIEQSSPCPSSSQQQQQPYPHEHDACMLRPIAEGPRKTDVLLGRGRGVFEWEGNQQFLQLVGSYCDVYQQASNKDDRGRWVTHIVLEVHNSGGRFLEQRQDNGAWYMASLEKARRKVGQALRYKLRQQSQKPKNNTHSNNNHVVATTTTSTPGPLPSLPRLVSTSLETYHTNTTTTATEWTTNTMKDHQISCSSTTNSNDATNHSFVPPTHIFIPTSCAPKPRRSKTIASFRLDLDEQGEIDPCLFEGLEAMVDLFCDEQDTNEVPAATATLNRPTSLVMETNDAIWEGLWQAETGADDDDLEQFLKRVLV